MAVSVAMKDRGAVLRRCRRRCEGLGGEQQRRACCLGRAGCGQVGKGWVVAARHR